MATESTLQAILQEIFDLKSPAIEEARRSNISEFIKTTVNGDDVVAYLAISANVKPDIMGALAYILTNRRVIKFDIYPGGEIKSVTFPLDTITGLERSIEGNREAVNLTFHSGSFGIKYNSPNAKITSFFQKVDDARVSKSVGSQS